MDAMATAEEVAVTAAAGRVTAGPVMARRSSPAAHQAAMDGFAVAAAATLRTFDPLLYLPVPLMVTLLLVARVRSVAKLVKRVAESPVIIRGVPDHALSAHVPADTASLTFSWINPG